MTPQQVAQEVLALTMKVTVAGRRDELKAAFVEAGIMVSDDNATVNSVTEPAAGSYSKLMSNLAKFPVAKIAAKKAFASHKVIV